MENDITKKRINFLIYILIIIVASLFFRLFQKQILEHANYLAQAKDQYIIKKELQQERGKIYASDMFPLATNKQFWQVLAIPKNIKNPDQVAEQLASILNLNKNDIFSQINNNKSYIPPLKQGLSEEEGDKIAVLKITGVVVIPQSRRFYPEGELASHILGFVNNLSEGQYGIEGYFDEILRGFEGEISAEKDIRGRFFNIGEKIDPQNGADLILTIDHNIQYQVEIILQKAIKEYKADSGSIIVIEPKTGAIWAMAGFPAFNPNLFNQVPEESQDVFNNPVITAAWEPGSVFKPLIMAAAINENKVSPETEGEFGNFVVVDSYEIHTSTDEAYGKETMTQVLENSDNVAMVWVSEQLGKELAYQYLKDFGFGRKTGIELDTEAQGEVLEVKKWSNTQRATIAFGQGIAVTPIQLISASAAIANGGKLMKPYLVSKIEDASGKVDVRAPQEIKRVLNEETAKKLREMMVSVVEHGHGQKAAVPGYKVAGKTGTAQIPAPGGGYYKDRHIGSFIGFAPADDPKFIMLVRLDQPKNVQWAESSAAPTFGEMAKWLLEYLRVPPTE